MKNILLIIIATLIIILGILGFNYYKSKNIPKTMEVKESEPIEIEIIDEEKEEKNPITVGLYKNYKNDGGRKLITEYKDKWSYHNDISSFEVYYTNEEVLGKIDQRKAFDEYKKDYENVDSYRIGYIINFNTTDKEINKTIISPKDTEEFYNYLEVYLYDDYHRNGGWYSHTTEKEFNDNTLLTSIKLTAGKDVKEITSDIKLTAFLYVNDDLDEEGIYKGKNTYTIVVKKEDE